MHNHGSTTVGSYENETCKLEKKLFLPVVPDRMVSRGITRQKTREGERKKIHVQWVQNHFFSFKPNKVSALELLFQNVKLKSPHGISGSYRTFNRCVTITARRPV